MYSSAYVWAKVLGHIENRMGAAATSTWFDDAEVVELNEQQLILYTPSPFRKDIIQRRCADYIKDAMQDVFETSVDLIVLGDEELAEYKSRNEKPKFVEFNPQFTFEKFVVGSSNRFAHAAAVAVDKQPCRRIQSAFDLRALRARQNPSALCDRRGNPQKASQLQYRIHQGRSVHQ